MTDLIGEGCEVGGHRAKRRGLGAQSRVHGKLDFDAVGHYARPDIFQLEINDRPLKPVRNDD